MKRIVGLVVAGLLVAAAPFTIRLAAVDLRDVLADYTLTSWTRKDGLTGPVWAIAQDDDGFLWLGHDEGLVRFDGVRFLNWAAMSGAVGGTWPSAPVRSLHVSRDGAIWVGFGGSGGIARVDKKHARVFSDVSIGPITAIVEDRARTMWAAGNNGLYHLDNDRWQRIGPDRGLPATPVTNAYVDTSGTLWIGAAAGLFWRPDPTEQKFQQIETAGDPLRALSLSEDSTGRIWTSDPLIGFRTLGDRTPPQLKSLGGEAGRGYRLLHDRNGNLWVGTIGQGLWRVRHSPAALQPAIERTTVLSGLSSDAVRSVFEDRDGNFWAGTTEGVDRLVPHRVTPWTGLGLVSTVDVTPDDRILVGTAEGLLRFMRTAGSWQPDSSKIFTGSVRAVRAGTRGRVWVLSAGGFFRIEDGRPVRAPLPPRTPAIDAIAADPSGGMFAVAHDGTILRDDGVKVVTVTHVNDLDNVRITSIFADRAGRLWVAYSGARIGLLHDTNQFTSYGAPEGLGSGPHYALFEDQERHVWIAGSDGLSRFADGRFSSIGRTNGLPPGGIFGITEDEQRNLWLGTSAGILRLPRTEFDAAVANAQYQIHYRLYDTSDGLAGFPAALGDRNAIRAGDGSLWFVTSRGLSVVQPRALQAGRPTPPIWVDAVSADDRMITAGALASLPPGTKKLQIDYTAPDVTSPLKMRFRYRLDGFDADWIDAGSRRQALYTDLPPRRYRFRAAVGGDEGRWSEQETVWDFAMAPRFYQTWWFYVLATFAIAATILAAWELRLRQLRRQFSLVLGERVRVSRELHDTLLQSLVGVALEFEAIAKSLDSAPAAAKERVINLRERVEEYIREARRSIWSLRSPALETRDLIEALRESGERATAGQPVRFEFGLRGTPRRYAGNLEHQLLRIGQEAVLNAVRHARAQTVKMTLEYRTDRLALRVADDGVGFARDVSAEGTTDHYGITTMKERAQQVGGDITITSRPDAGTVIEAVVPAVDDGEESRSA